MEKDEAECQMRKLMSYEMVRRNLEVEMEEAERKLSTIYGLSGKDYVAELQKMIECEERELKELKESSAALREERQARLEVAQMECSKLDYELNSSSTAIESLTREIKNVEQKLKDAAVSSN
ncbi:hypothetical protein NECAME_10546, partial [Necator americanus]